MTNQTLELTTVVTRTYSVDAKDYPDCNTPEEVANFERDCITEGDVSPDEVFDDLTLCEVTVTVNKPKQAE